jgi:hypothetical protein
MDNATPGASLRYYVYRSAANNIGTAAACESNGILLNAGGTVNITSLAVMGLVTNTQYWFNVVVEDAAGNRAAYGAMSVLTASSKAPDTATLGALIGDVKAILNDAVNTGKIGDGPGQYSQVEVDALSAAIAAAESVMNDPSATQQAIDAAITELQQAVSRFKNSANDTADNPDKNSGGNPDSDDLGGGGGCGTGASTANMAVLVTGILAARRAARKQKR